ncbi:MAG TPA: glycosyl hydrolase family 28-related protein [Candidatus Saccharimonadia bacterium]|nr:glycosyl hydrolase family 28-related protein [Candidatus Saccharimonadia bacterium]
MARLPKPGSDEGIWAQLLNDYLLVAHNADGTPRTDGGPADVPFQATVGLTDLRTTNAPGENIQKLRLSNDGTNLVWKRDTVIDVHDFGAVGDGVTDDTAAIQVAIDSAAMGGAIVFPRGIYMVTGLKLRTHGTQLVGGARWGTRIVRLSGTQPLVDMSGTAPVNGHLKYCSLFNIMLSGNFLPGVLLRSYYSDNGIFLNTSFIHCDGLAVDFVEVWDTRFDNCSWEDCGSLTDPATLFRNSTPPGTFGYSTDNTNQIHFLGCRWESFRNGAVRLDGAANGSASLLNGVFFVSCKMETRFAAGSALQLYFGTTIVFVKQLYIAIDSADPSYTSPIDAIEDHASHVFITAVYVQWGPAVGLANSLVHIWNAGPHMYFEMCSFYPTEGPATGSVVVEPAASIVMISCFWSNRGQAVVGQSSAFLEGGQTMGYMFPIDNTGTFRIVTPQNTDLIGVSNNTTRPAFQAVNGLDVVGFSDAYVTEKWRVIGATGAARFAAGKFQIESTKGYAAINAMPFTSIALLIRAAVEGDRGIAVVRPTSTATNRLMEFQDETYNIQGLSIDSNGRPVAVGTPPRVTPGAQVSYANPGLQVRDIAGNITAAVRPSPTAPGTIASVTFSRPYNAAPLSIILNDNSATAANLYISARSATGFTVSTRSALGGGSILNFDYVVIA